MVYIDVRTSAEYETGHVDGAINHDIMEMMNGIFPNVNKEEEIVLYCESGNRSMMAKSMMEGEGFQNIKNGGSLEEVMSIKFHD